MNVLGINFQTHDAAAALILDGQVKFAIEEERLIREKHTKKFPFNSIEYCLSEAKLKEEDIEAVAIFVKPSLHFNLIFNTLFSDFPKSLKYINHASKIIKKRFNIKKEFRDFSGISDKKLFFVPHHYAHASGSFFTSPFEESAILCIDGRGEYESITAFFAKENRIKKISNVKYPHSLGYLYSMITKYLGFETQSDEYKVMGLSAFGSDKLVEKMKDLIKYDKNKFRLNLNYFDHHYASDTTRNLFTRKLIDLLGSPKTSGEELKQIHADISYALQRITEEVILKQAIELKKNTQSNNLCISGGVALNCLANQKIIERGLFKRIYVQPAAGDSGTSIGAALFYSFLKCPNTRRYYSNNIYLGPEYSNKYVASVLNNQTELKFKYVQNPGLLAATLLNEGYVIGWFQGRMEFGPRALGNRSILASPKESSMKDLVNKKIKFREPFRPFAPAVLEEQAKNFFNLDSRGELVYPYMISTVNAKENTKILAPAIVHYDGTSRIQVVSKKNNRTFWNLINSFSQLSGIPIVLNTSFNVSGEPIVCSPQDALSNFKNSGLDFLIMQNYLIQKSEYNHLEIL